MDKKDLVDISTIVTNAIKATVPDMIKSAIEQTVPGMIKSAIEQTVPGMIKETVKDLLEQNNHILKREMRDEIYSANKALRSEIKADLRIMRTEIAELLDYSILPQITELQHNVTLLKEKVGV